MTVKVKMHNTKLGYKKPQAPVIPNPNSKWNACTARHAGTKEKKLVACHASGQYVLWTTQKNVAGEVVPLMARSQMKHHCLQKSRKWQISAPGAE